MSRWQKLAIQVVTSFKELLVLNHSTEFKNPMIKEIEMMKRLVSTLAAFFLFSLAAFAAGPKTYQVTGPVLDIKGDIVTVQKGTEKWEITFDKNTKVTGDLKVGSKVTIEYQMKATAIVVKPETAKPAAAKKK
jgi:hypothetical protein